MNALFQDCASVRSHSSLMLRSTGLSLETKLFDTERSDCRKFSDLGLFSSFCRKGDLSTGSKSSWSTVLSDFSRDGGFLECATSCDLAGTDSLLGCSCC